MAKKNLLFIDGRRVLAIVKNDYREVGDLGENNRFYFTRSYLALPKAVVKAITSRFVVSAEDLERLKNNTI